MLVLWMWVCQELAAKFMGDATHREWKRIEMHDILVHIFKIELDVIQGIYGQVSEATKYVSRNTSLLSKA